MRKGTGNAVSNEILLVGDVLIRRVSINFLKISNPQIPKSPKGIIIRVRWNIARLGDFPKNGGAFRSY
jgi:hypothetical protein